MLAYLKAAAEYRDPEFLLDALDVVERARRRLETEASQASTVEGPPATIESSGPTLSSVMRRADALGFELTFRRRKAA